MVRRKSGQRKSSFWVVPRWVSGFADSAWVLLAVVVAVLLLPVVLKSFDEDERSRCVGVACDCFGLATQSDGHTLVASGLMFKLYMSAVGGR